MTGGGIVIAGAGPAGMVTAASLAKNGVPVTVLEAASKLPHDLRATTFHPPTLDLLDDLGIAQKLVSLGTVVPKRYRGPLYMARDLMRIDV